MFEHFDPDAPSCDGRLFGLPHGAAASRVLVLPVPFDATTSFRKGTSDAPNAILLASAQVDLCDLQTGNPWREGIAMDNVDSRILALNITAGDAVEQARQLDDSIARQEAIDTANRAGAMLNDLVDTWTEACLNRAQIPAILGGDHSVPLGAIRAAARKHPGIGVLHIDAHADLRVRYEGFEWSHASIMHNALTHAQLGPLVQVGVRDLGQQELERTTSSPQIHLWSDHILADHLADGVAFKTLAKQIIALLPQDVWISFDIDGLDPSLCPSTGTPVPGGLSWREALQLLSILGRSGRRIVGFDLCEVGAEPWDANVGARLLYKLSGWAIASQRSN